MKIAMLTTENSACGIAEYSRHFVEEYEKLGHEVLVLGNPKYFGVYWWGEGSHFDTPAIWEALDKFRPDVFHVQYQSSIYETEEFNHLMCTLFTSSCVYKTVVTVHDSSRGGHDLSIFNHTIYHKDGIVMKGTPGAHKLPFPILQEYPLVYSFGMGRNDYKLIAKVCKDLDVGFDFHDSRKDGWLEEDNLMLNMKLADVIVLWYNEASGIIGASAAARTALASHRPVITNNVSWFSDLDNDIFSIVANEWQLKAAIEEVLHLDYIRENSYANIAEEIIDTIYGG